MRPLALVLAVSVMGCGSSGPTAPPAPPPPTPTPIHSLIGIWSGSWRIHQSTRVPIPGVRRSNFTVDCTTTWFVTEQTGRNWSGNYTRAGHPDCENAGPIGGTVNEGRVVTMGRADSLFETEWGRCHFVYNDSLHRGTLSGATIQVEADLIERCPYWFGDLDWTIRSTVSVTRR